MKIIETTVKRQRKALGLTLNQLAQKLEISIGQVSRLERGLSEPRILQALKVAEILDCSVRELWPSSRVLKIEQPELVDKEKRDRNAA